MVNRQKAGDDEQSRHAGGIDSWALKWAMAMPTSKPPIALAAKVPNGKFITRGLSQKPGPSRPRRQWRAPADGEGLDCEPIHESIFKDFR